MASKAPVIDFSALTKGGSLMASLEASLQPKEIKKDGPVTSKVTTAFPLNEDQAAAVSAMVQFLDRKSEMFFRLVGPAGTGKTFCIKDLINRIRGRLVFTAPTNKATKVLRESVTTDDYKPDCRTIYSLLGLKLEANGEIQELAAPEDPIDLSRFLAVVVDEASMLNKQLVEYMVQAAETQNIQFILMGDEFQLPPVGEKKSVIWALDAPEHRLTKVMRHDNQILALVTRIRGLMSHPCPTVRVVSDNDGTEGVWEMKAVDFYAKMREMARAGHFTRVNGAKAVAWRNVTVDEMNKVIRNEIFDNPAAEWVVGDRLTMLAPAKDFDGEDVAHTDDEGVVTAINEAWHPLYEQFLCNAVSVTFDDNHTGTVWLIHPSARAEFERYLTSLAAQAREQRSLWKTYWQIKESFHSAKHAYAITAHRAQGSTYEIGFVNYRDILLNRDRVEALKCLYVAFTRFKKMLHSS
jgi:hypothetical protein